MGRIFLKTVIVLISFSFLSFANSEDKSLKETELNLFTGMFDFSDSKQASGLIGLQHQNDELFRKSFLGKLSPITKKFEAAILLVIPRVSISTEWAYSQLKNKLKSDNSILRFANLMRKDFLSFKFFENDFEKIVIPAYPEIGSIKNKLLDSGAKFASLSGSGSTVFGIFDDNAYAKKAKSHFHNSHLTILTRPI